MTLCCPTQHPETVKPAISNYPLHPLIESRWSPRAFTNEDISIQDVGSLLEAARWSASCFNEQPWRFFVGHKTESPETYAKIFDTLVEFNQQWSEPVPLLILGVANLHFSHNGKPNAHAEYDLGQATTSLILQAQALGYHAHSMAGFDTEAAIEAFGIPRGFAKPVAVTAIGKAAPADTLKDDGMRDSETAPRERNAIQQFSFEGHWQQPFTRCYN
jgi:nitroreductase